MTRNSITAGKAVAPAGEARIVELLNDHGELAAGSAVFRLVINVGAAKGVKNGDRYLIYALGPELKDPESGESLGALEIVRGPASVVHVQENMSVVRTSETRTEMIYPKAAYGIMGLGGKVDHERIQVAVPFRAPQVGDFARPV